MDKQTLCVTHLFTSYSHNYTCSLWNCSDNRATAPLKQKYYIVKQLIGQLLVYFMTLLVQICVTLRLLVLYFVAGRCQVCLDLERLSFYFSVSDMIQMGFMNAQLDSH